MKKLFVHICLLHVLFSCQKENNLGEDYKVFMGTWENFDGDISVKYVFNKNGKFERYSSFNRKYVEKIKNVEIGEISPLNQRKVRFDFSNKLGYLYLNNTLDTIISSFVLYIEDFNYNYSKTTQLIKTN